MVWVAGLSREIFQSNFFQQSSLAMPGCKLQGFVSYEHTSPGTFAVTAPQGAPST